MTVRTNDCPDHALTVSRMAAEPPGDEQEARTSSGEDGGKDGRASLKAMVPGGFVFVRHALSARWWTTLAALAAATPAREVVGHPDADAAVRGLHA